MSWSAQTLRALVPAETWVPVYGSPAWAALPVEDPLRLAAAIRAAERWAEAVQAAAELADVARPEALPVEIVELRTRRRTVPRGVASGVPSATRRERRTALV